MVVPDRRALHYAISDLSTHVSDAPPVRRMRLRTQLRQWAVDGVDVVQLREKWMEAGELLALAEDAMDTLHSATPPGARRPRLVVNGRPDVALAGGADGVHLTAKEGELTLGQVRRLFHASSGAPALVSVSCHTRQEVVAAVAAGADVVLFGPVFEKRVGDIQVADGVGLTALREACIAAGSTPILALGGITAGNIPSCLQAGVAGFAGIRLFAKPL